MARSRLALPVAALLLAVLVACGRPPESPPTPVPPPKPAAQPTTAAAPAPPTKAPAAPVATAAAPAAQTTQPAPAATKAPPAIPRGGDLIVGKDQEAPSLDPHKTTSLGAIRIFDLTYSRLTRLDDQMRPVPDLAEKWEQPDGKTYVFHLRKGVKFHNGRELTSEDVKYSFERILNPNTAAISQSFFEPIAKIETPDKYTVKFTLKEPFSALLVNTGSPWAAIVAKEVVEANAGKLDKVEAGSGPFKLQEWTPDTRTILVRNPDYYVAGQPYLDRITYLIMKEEAARIAALRTGNIHLTTLTTAGAETLKKGDPGITVLSHPTVRWYYLGLNVAKKPFDDVRVRQAVSYAVDRQELIDVAFAGQATLTAPIPAVMKDWTVAQSKLPSHKPDLNKAKQLLAEAGYPNGFKTSIMLNATYPYSMEASQLVQNQLKKVGIQAEIQPLESGVYVDTWRKKGMEMMLGANSAGADPDRAISFYFTTKGSANVWNFSDEKVDELAVKARQAADPAEAKRLYEEVQIRLVDLAPNLFLVNSNGFQAHLPKVKGYKTMPDYTEQYFVQTYLQP